VDKHYDRLGINLFILSIAIIFSLYITYSLGNYYDYSLKADSNPLIRTDDAALESASYKGDKNVVGVNLVTLSAEGSERENIHEGQNIESDNSDIDNVDTYIKDTDIKEIGVTEEIPSVAKIKTMVGGLKQEGTEIVTMAKGLKQEGTGIIAMAEGLKRGGTETENTVEKSKQEETGTETAVGKLKQEKVETETITEKPRQKEIELGPEKLQAMGIVSRKITISDSKPQKDENLDETLNKYVLNVIKTYEAGNYPYLLNNDYQNYNGVTENLYYDGKLLLKANPNGNRACHCTGITFEVFFKAMQNRNRDLGLDINNFNGMNKGELYDFALTWYAAKGSGDMSNVALAMEKYGVGKRIYDMEELRAGDFIDFSRENGTGHCAVFINWIREGDRIIGIRYWSSQGSTNGTNYNEEYFNVKRKNGSKYGNVMTDNFYMGRISPVNEYKGFK